MNGPETRYISVGDADVAYQVLGEGPLDLLYFYGMGSHIEFAWESPAYAEFFMRLASFSRLIMFDRRGTGSSDGISRSAIPTWEEWTEDIVAVLDAAGSRRAAILAATDSGPIAILLAAMHPELVSALVLFNTTARYLEADDYPIGAPPEAVDATVQLIATGWGTNELTRLANPSMADDAEWIRFTSKAIRSSATPRTAAAQFNYILRNDVRQALPLIQAPTLVLHAKESALVPIAHGRYLAEHIDGATFVELPGGDSTTTPELYVIADEVAEFLTGERPVVEVERILTTVVFTDIVGSTARAASLGDQRWRSLLDAHDRTVRDELRRFRGRVINTTGDGFVASFDGPARAIRCSQAISQAAGKLGIELRIGLHTGECEVRGEDLGGLAVHIAARVGALASPGEIVVSGTLKDLVVGSGIEFVDRGDHELKGVPGSWKLFAVVG
ncbi:MAG: adenylate/guanylate cyclase domain-containing protein [Actinomycetota bacterium]|nr:adenylate/guanylate cyclase domain-containing protein [Actinomycetota bacterium]